AIKSRSDVSRYLRFARSYLERQTGEKVLNWHMDQAGEHGAKVLREVCEQEGITITYTATGAHQQNGEQERWFRSAFDSVRAHRIATGAPVNLWADGIANYVYVHNRMVHGGSTKTPYELTFGKKPNVEDLRVLYCLVYARTLPRH